MNQNKAGGIDANSQPSSDTCGVMAEKIKLHEEELQSSSRIHETTAFDRLLKDVGEFSKFQYIQWFLLFLAVIPQSWYTYAPAFAARKVREPQMSCTKAPNITGKGFCAVWMGNTTYCGDVQYSTDFTSIATDWDIICDESKKYIPLTKTIFYAGKLVGAYLFGWISDRYGRRVTLLSTMFIQFVASLIQSFSVNFTMYVILRIPIGICSGGTFIAAFALMAEMVAPNRRNWANTLEHSAYGVGIALEALLAYFVRDWMPFNLAITIPNVFFVLFYCFVPESPRWLTARGRFKEAEVILRKIAKTNGRQYQEGALEQVESNLQQKEQATKTYHLWHLFSTGYLVKITLIEGWSWFVTSGVYYGLGFNSGNLSGNFYVNFAASGLVEIPAYILAGYLVDRIGRRLPLIAYYVVGGVALLCILPIQALGKQEEYSAAVTALALIGKFTISAAYYQIYIHSAELYPTVIRTIGVGFASLCARVGAMGAPYVADSTPLIAPAIIFGGLSLTAGVLTFFLPETRGKPLPDYIHTKDDATEAVDLKTDLKEETKMLAEA